MGVVKWEEDCCDLSGTYFSSSSWHAQIVRQRSEAKTNGEWDDDRVQPFSNGAKANRREVHVQCFQPWPRLGKAFGDNKESNQDFIFIPDGRLQHRHWPLWGKFRNMMGDVLKRGREFDANSCDLVAQSMAYLPRSSDAGCKNDRIDYEVQNDESVDDESNSIGIWKHHRAL